MRRIHNILGSAVTGGAGASSAAGKGTLYLGGTQIINEASVDTVLCQLSLTPTTIAASSTVTVSLSGSLNNADWYDISSSSFTGITTASGTPSILSLSLPGPVPLYVRVKLAITNGGADTTSSVTINYVLLQVTLDPRESAILAQ